MSDGRCEMYLPSIGERCGEPASFQAESKYPEVAALERGDGEFCFAHAVKLAGYFLEDGRPEYRIAPQPPRPVPYQDLEPPE